MELDHYNRLVIETEITDTFKEGDVIRCRRLLDYDLSYTEFTLSNRALSWRRVQKTDELYLSYGGYCVWINGLYAENITRNKKVTNYLRMTKEEIKPNQIYKCDYNIKNTGTYYYYLVYFDKDNVSYGYLVGLKEHENHPQNHKIQPYGHSIFADNNTISEYNESCDERYIDFVNQLKAKGIVFETTYSII